MDVHFGLFHGLEINIESLRSRVAGSIACATPDDLNSPPARDGTLFLLPDKSEKEWLDGGPRCRSRRELG
jgi:paraquat-inducible protein B